MGNKVPIFDLNRYQRDIVIDALRMEVFICDILELFDSREEARQWFEDQFQPAFESLLEEKE